MTVTDFKEIQAKSILVPCKIPGIDFTINPYTGCQFGCTYCYASFMGRFIPGKTIGDWGNYVFAKVNAPELLKIEIRRLRGKGLGKEVFMSSVTDPYQGLEAKYKLTRRCLEVLVDYGFQGEVSILTKSPLVTRDIDVFKKLNKVSVGMTVTSTSDSVSRYFERYAPPASSRFESLKKLNENGINTYAFLGPLLPHFVANPKGIEDVFRALKKVGTKRVFVEHINLSKYIRNRLFTEMKGADKGVMSTFYVSQTKDYRKELDKIVQELIRKYDLQLLSQMVIYHREYQKLNDSRRLTDL